MNNLNEKLNKSDKIIQKNKNLAKQMKANILRRKQRDQKNG
ncbi:hypothetical protein [Lyticum sinuosum]|uniref:Uncharacterized protein n=1 Tax=Lyticum sinuosum TaxID=1332059 RepID=A0AAE5AHM1_9RICK|nr:hypothetical protein [Lyticum sinuosum]MDZ5761328.1 hypothetical protein [Lyticum sinuosum]